MQPALKELLASALADAVAIRAAVPLDCIAYSLLIAAGQASASDQTEEQYVAQHRLQATLQSVVAGVGEPSAVSIGMALLAASEAERQRRSSAIELELLAKLAAAEVEQARLADSFESLGGEAALVAKREEESAEKARRCGLAQPPQPSQTSAIASTSTSHP